MHNASNSPFMIHIATCTIVCKQKVFFGNFKLTLLLKIGLLYWLIPIYGILFEGSYNVGYTTIHATFSNLCNAFM